jgi:hypothetical protein
MSSQPEWQIVSELKKQYDLSQVGLDQPITEKIDVLLVAQVSSLTQPQMNVLSAYIKQGGAALLVRRPVPEHQPALAPGEAKQSPNRASARCRRLRASPRATSPASTPRSASSSRAR